MSNKINFENLVIPIFCGYDLGMSYWNCLGSLLKGLEVMDFFFKLQISWNIYFKNLTKKMKTMMHLNLHMNFDVI